MKIIPRGSLARTMIEIRYLMKSIVREVGRELIRWSYK